MGVHRSACFPGSCCGSEAEFAGLWDAHVAMAALPDGWGLGSFAVRANSERDCEARCKSCLRLPKQAGMAGCRRQSLGPIPRACSLTSAHRQLEQATCNTDWYRVSAWTYEKSHHLNCCRDGSVYGCGANDIGQLPLGAPALQQSHQQPLQSPAEQPAPSAQQQRRRSSPLSGGSRVSCGPSGVQQQAAAVLVPQPLHLPFLQVPGLFLLPVRQAPCFL